MKIKLPLLLILVIILSSGDTPNIKYCIVRTINCYSGKIDTIYFKKVHCGFCIATFEGDTIPKLVDGRHYIYRDSTCDFTILFHKDKRLNKEELNKYFSR